MTPTHAPGARPHPATRPISRIERLEPRSLFAAGLVDTAFDGDGVRATDLGSIEDVEVAPDGKVYVLGFSRTNNNGDVVRYNRDGSLDRTFSGDGKLTNAAPWAEEMLLLRDGRFLVAGSETDAAGFALMYRPDGTVDTSFGNAGRAPTGLGTGSVQDWLEQPDGKILISGQYRPDAYTPPEMTLTRLNPNGTLDSGFGRGGVRRGIINIGGHFTRPDLARASGSLALYPDGRILVSAGVSTGIIGPSAPMLYRLERDGTADVTFSGSGSFYFDLSPGVDRIGRVFVTPDNKILGAGTYNGTDWAVMRLVSSTTSFNVPRLDPTFDGDGVLTGTFPADAGAAGGMLGLRGNGQFVVVGTGRSTTSTGYRYLASRHNADGSLDATFGPNRDGRFAGTFGQTDPIMVATAMNGDGAVAFGGLLYGTVESTWTVAKLTGDADAPPPPPPPPPPMPRGAIGGSVFNDQDADGRWDATEPPSPPGEAGLANVRVYVDADRDGRFDVGEFSAVTDRYGAYRITGLTAGTHRIRQVLPAGFRVTNPSKAYHDVRLADGQQVGGKNFGDTQKVLVSGTLYHDLNGSGGRNSGEPALSGWRVFLDADNDGVFDSGERSVLTGTSGAYTFNNLPAGTYRVRIVRPAGWRVTQPSSGAHSLTLASGVASTGRHFGVTQKVLISGTVFNDLNANGKRNSGETGLSGRRVFIDADKDGVLDSTERSVRTDSAGNWSFKDLSAGTYVVRLVPLSGWRATVPTGSAYTLTPGAGAAAAGRLFGQRRAT